MNSKTILVVEDEPFILNNICTILEISGYSCSKAGNGQEALEVLQHQIPQLILCDVMMPVMNGFELLEHLQSSENLSSIPFCFLSARADVIDIDNGLSIGAKAYITKPFLAKDLLQTVQKLLGNI
ncbi:MAG: response regulator [Bacteroidetes bacterium]|jgi:CheY-like chemotaxis protein|nr:response regulator [Bacteroidota bacterium]